MFSLTVRQTDRRTDSHSDYSADPRVLQFWLSIDFKIHLYFLNPKYNKICHAPALPTIYSVFRHVPSDLCKFLNVNKQERMACLIYLFVALVFGKLFVNVNQEPIIRN